MSAVQYKALIQDTILKEVRSKTLIFIFVATTISIILAQMGISAILTNMGGDGQNLFASGQDVLGLVFRVLNIVSFSVAVVFGVSVFKSDFKNNIIYQYLAFPISRTEYFYIRVLGTWFLVLGYYFYSYILSAILYSFTFKEFVFSVYHLANFLTLALYLLLVIFIAIFFSLFLNKLGALFVTFVTSIFAAFAYGNISKLASEAIFQDITLFKGINIFFYYLFPRISFLDDVSSSLLLTQKLPDNVLEHSIHLVIVVGLYIFLANYLVKRKDF